MHLTNIDRLANDLANASGKVTKDETTMFKNDIFENIGNFLVDKKVGKNKSALSKLGNTEIKNAAKNLKREFTALKNTVKDLGLSEKEIDDLFRGDIDRYLNRSFELVRNSKYKVRDTDREAVSGLFVNMLRKSKVYKDADEAVIKQAAELFRS